MHYEVYLGKIECDHKEAAEFLLIEGNLKVGKADGDIVQAGLSRIGEKEGEVEVPIMLSTGLD